MLHFRNHHTAASGLKPLRGCCTPVNGGGVTCCQMAGAALSGGRCEDAALPGAWQCLFLRGAVWVRYNIYFGAVRCRRGGTALFMGSKLLEMLHPNVTLVI
jgi:hypothetical protein